MAAKTAIAVGIDLERFGQNRKYCINFQQKQEKAIAPIENKVGLAHARERNLWFRNPVSAVWQRVAPTSPGIDRSAGNRGSDADSKRSLPLQLAEPMALHLLSVEKYGEHPVLKVFLQKWDAATISAVEGKQKSNVLAHPP